MTWYANLAELGRTTGDTGHRCRLNRGRTESPLQLRRQTVAVWVSPILCIGPMAASASYRCCLAS